MFKVLYNSKKKKSKARIGEIITSHGVIKTPSFVAVGTKGTIKSIFPPLLKEIGTQVAFVNTYHLVTHPGADII
ncbi:MAG: tRNA-guanine transglycosylase, partial [Microgenomates group bacterium]